jgi:hypothetical protein
MSNVLFVIATLCLILIPLVPKLVRFRIRILKWLQWTWTANLLEKHFDAWVLLRRIVLFLIAALLFYIGWKALQA